jgi:hypothetical protein
MSRESHQITPAGQTLQHGPKTEVAGHFPVGIFASLTKHDLLDSLCLILLVSETLSRRDLFSFIPGTNLRVSLPCGLLFSQKGQADAEPTNLFYS